MASVARRIEDAFNAAGYGERSYFRIPGGFALVSRLEQILPDATPVAPPARWAAPPPVAGQGFMDYIRLLFYAPPGFYRVIVFAVTDQDISAGSRAPTPEEARSWISSGSLRLPANVGALVYTAQHDTTALIYEFQRGQGQNDVQARVPSAALGQTHLEKAGLWPALARPTR